MELSRKQFDILAKYATLDEELSQGEIAKQTCNSLEDTFKIVRELTEAGYIENGRVTSSGLVALEPYKVKRVVFLAAGFGSRMVPITINTPKPLVRVNGKPIIETLIDAVISAGIEEIYIVRGYLGEQFELLQKKYPTIKLIDNLDYENSGTISSFYYARHLLDHAYVMESDLVVNNRKIIHKYHYSSDFMGTKVDETDDWYLKTDDSGIINEIGIKGKGNNCYKLIGISYWNGYDGKQLEKDIEEAYDSPGGHMLPMSHIPFRIYKDKYSVAIMPCHGKDVVEIDSFKELQEYDEAYAIRRDNIKYNS